MGDVMKLSLHPLRKRVTHRLMLEIVGLNSKILKF